MSPRFDPNDYDPSKDAGGFTPPPEGDYEFTVTNAEQRQSQAGNDMLNVALSFEIDGRPLNVFDSLVFVPKAIWKIAQFCQATGHDFRSGELEASDCMGMSGKAHLVLGEPNNKGRRYMQVAYYCKPEGYSERPASAKPAPQVEARPAAQPAQRAATRPTPPPAPIGAADDQIPF